MKARSLVAVCNQSRCPRATASSVDGGSAADLESIGRLYAGRVAQLEEHYLDTVGVIGSSPVAPIIGFNRLQTGRSLNRLVCVVNCDVTLLCGLFSRFSAILRLNSKHVHRFSLRVHSNVAIVCQHAL